MAEGLIEQIEALGASDAQMMHSLGAVGVSFRYDGKLYRHAVIGGPAQNILLDWAKETITEMSDARH